MSGKIVYRATDPAVIAACDAAQDALTAYRQKTGDVLDNLVPGMARRMISTGDRPGRFLGLHPDDGIPEGWRDNKAGFAVPDTGTAAGKAASKALDSIRYPGDPRSSLPGMPGEVFTAGRHLTCGVQQIGDALYVTWSSDPAPCKTVTGRPVEIDSALWERVKLSEYYAAAEDADAEPAATP